MLTLTQTLTPTPWVEQYLLDPIQGPLSPNILKNDLSLVLQIFLYLETFESNATFD